MNKIVHIGNADNFMPPLIDFIKENFDFASHRFFFISEIHKFDTKNSTNVILIKGLKTYLDLFKSLFVADKIFLHGLFGLKTLLILFFQPWLLKKCYWVIWGGDLMFYKVPKTSFKGRFKEFIRKFVIKRVGNISCLTKGDYELAKQFYNTKARYHSCFIYPNSFYREISIGSKPHDTINVMVGHNAYASNNHKSVFELLKNFEHDSLRIYSPLSYGSESYANQIIKIGRELFGDKFIPLTKYMPLNEYNDFLNSMDFVIFNHDHQQGLANIIVLLGLGKTVYLRDDITSWKVFEDLGIVLKYVKNIDLVKLDDKTIESNISRVKSYFSKEQLVKDLNQIFNS